MVANSDIKGEPGLQDENVERLRKIADEYKNKYNSKLKCSLIFDEIHLRSNGLRWVHRLWSKVRQKCCGKAGNCKLAVEL